MPKPADSNRPAADKIRAQRAAAQRRKRKRIWLIGSVAATVAAAVGVSVALTAGSAGGTTRPTATITPDATAIGNVGPEGVPIPPGTALASTQPTGQQVDAISCQTSEQTLFHIHAHLTIFVNGKPEQVPAG